MLSWLVSCHSALLLTPLPWQACLKDWLWTLSMPNGAIWLAGAIHQRKQAQLSCAGMMHMFLASPSLTVHFGGLKTYKTRQLQACKSMKIQGYRIWHLTITHHHCLQAQKAAAAAVARQAEAAAAAKAAAQEAAKEAERQAAAEAHRRAEAARKEQEARRRWGNMNTDAAYDPMQMCKVTSSLEPDQAAPCAL